MNEETRKRAAAHQAEMIWRAEFREKERVQRERRAQEKHLVAEVEQFLMDHGRSEDGSSDGSSGTTEPDGHPED